MPPKKKGDIPASWQRRKDGEVVAVWLPADVVKSVRVLHESSKWGPAWKADDTWGAVVRHGMPRLRRLMERDRIPAILWKVKRGES